MVCLRRFIGFLFCFCLLGNATAQTAVKDSLKNLLKVMEEPEQRVDLLLHLKDLHENSELNLDYSLRLFDEARQTRDVYALGVAIVPIILQYATYPEKQDSLSYYLTTLRTLIQSTPEEGMISYCEMLVHFERFKKETDRHIQKAEAGKILAEMSARQNQENKYEKVKRLFLTAFLNIQIVNGKGKNLYVEQIPVLEEAWELARTFSGNTRKSYTGLIYHYLSGGYNQKKDYDQLIQLSNAYLEVLDDYYNSKEVKERRTYLYKDNVYVKCYSQLIRGSLNIRNKLAYDYYELFRKHMLSAREEHLRRNKIYLYEIGYLLMGNTGKYTEALSLCDSLIHLVETGQAGGYQYPLRPFRDKAILLRNMGKEKEACDAYERVMAVTDSLTKKEYNERLKDMRQNHDIDRLKLEESQLLLKNRRTLFIAFLVSLFLIMGISIYLYYNLRRTQKLQKEILRQNIKAREGEQMKSIFINSICSDLHTPFGKIKEYTDCLLKASSYTELQKYREAIQGNTMKFLSILDTLLEAANLDSLSEGLPLEQTDVALLCKQELERVRDSGMNRQIDYRLEVPQEGCFIRTHAHYFSLVLRALLNNAAKFTEQGSVLLQCQKNELRNRVEIRVTDTGCGIPPDHYETIFKRFIRLDNSIPGNGLGLPLCRLIARSLHGDIFLDTSYKQGARFIFSVPPDVVL